MLRSVRAGIAPPHGTSPESRFKAPVRPGDTITGHVEVTSVREDKPITELATRVVRDDGTVAIEGSAVCYTLAL